MLVRQCVDAFMRSCVAGVTGAAGAREGTPWTMGERCW